MIEKITDQNLERYDSRLKEWCDRKFFEKGSYGKYQTTEEAGAVAFYPVPNTPLEGKVKFSFKETMPTEGDKGPNNSSTITGISNITVTHCESEGIDSTDYTISLGNTYYGGEIDLATGVMTVMWEKIDVNSSVLDAFASYLTYVGTNTVGIAVSCEILGGRTKIKQYKSAFSNRFEQTNSSSYTVDAECIYTTTGSNNCVLKINKSRLPNDVDYTDTDSIKNAFIEWFTNNPTYIVYKLETPFTVQLTAPQIFSLIQTDKYTPRLNTVYTDADSVQISYLKSLIRDEYEKTQAILSLGGNS